MPDFPINPISMDGYLQTLSASAIRDLMSEAESESKFTQFLPGDFIPVTPAGSSGESGEASGIPSKDVDPDVSGGVPAQGSASVTSKSGGQPSEITAAYAFEDRYIPGEEVPLNTWTPYSPAQNLLTQRLSAETAAAVLQAYASAQGDPASSAAQGKAGLEGLPSAIVSGETVQRSGLLTAQPSAQSSQTPEQTAVDTASAMRVVVSGREIVLRAVPTDKTAFAAPLKEMLSPMAELKNTTVRQAFRGDSFSLLEFDAPHTQQILSRLLTSSLGFSAGGGPINLIVDTQILEDNAVRLRFVMQAQQLELPPTVLSYVSENGSLPVGPPLENLALNLSLCRQLAALMNGSLAVRSDQEGGTLFYLELPARQCAPGSTAVTGEIGRFSGRRILLAMADSPAFREIAELLHRREMLPDAETNGDGAVTRFSESRIGYYDAIVTSLDGDTIRRMRTLPRSDAARVPILSLLPDPSGAALSAAFESGCSACLPLPVTPPELFDTLGLLML